MRKADNDRFFKNIRKSKGARKKMKESQEAIKRIEAIGSSGGDLVKVKLNGEGEMISLEISEKLLNEEKNVIEDLIKAAHNNAKSSLKTKTTEEISKSAGNFGVPGFKWPL